MTADKRPLIAKIHIAKAEMGWDDETYRTILLRVTGKDSSAKCRYSQLNDLLTEFKDLGWKGGAKKKTYRKASSPGIKKIYAQWGELQRLGEVQSTDKTALDAFVKKHTGVDSVQWLDFKAASKIIEILKKWIERVS